MKQTHLLSDPRVGRSGSRSDFPGGYSYSVRAGAVLVSELAAGLGVFV